MTATRSRRRRGLASEISPEVSWYLESRGYDLPECQPLVRTPEPRTVRKAAFDPDRVDRVIAALSALRHTKGKWAGRPLRPNSVQVAHIIAPVFGWTTVNSAGRRVRIIRDAYVEMPRKGAKTTLVSGLATVLAFADGEAGAEVLMGAASRDQAGQAFKPIAALARSSEALRKAGIKATRAEIVQPATSSVIKVVSSRGDLAHGANVHGGLVDELHVHRDPGLLEAIESGAGAREQPLVFIITTADDGKVVSVYATRREQIEKLASRVLKAPAMWGVVFAAEESDDPASPVTWAKANPLYPVTPSPEFMASAWDKAQGSPAQMASFQRLHLGIRSRQSARFFDLARWDRNASLVDEQALSGRVAYGGLDLGSVSDLTALAWLFPAEQGLDVLVRLFMPEASLGALDDRTARNASGWVKDGWIQLTPGDVTDYDFIKAQVRRDMDTFAVRGIGYDRWNASQLVTDLDGEGAPMVKVGQGFASLSGPLKELGRLVMTGTARKPMLRHGGNPVLRWMADNLRPATDAAENVKPDKARSMEKIDGISAMTTAMAVLLAADTASVSQESAYEGRGVVVV